MRQTALITGATGQDGSFLAEYLASLGHEVVGVVRETPHAPPGEVTVGTRLLRADINNEAQMNRVLADVRPSRIYHLAAHHHSSQEQSRSASPDAWNQMLKFNYQATAAIAYATMKEVPEAHLVFSASSQMYTARDVDLEVNETTRREPATFYGHAKSLSMDLLAFLRTHLGLHASTAILFNHESPRRGQQFVTRKITRMAALAKRRMGGRLEVLNLGARADWSAAQDTVRALHLMAEAKQAGDYVVASGTVHTVRDVLDVAFAHLRLDWRSCVDYREDRSVPALIGRPEWIEHTLAWRRTLSFEQMITQMVDADLEQIP